MKNKDLFLQPVVEFVVHMKLETECAVVHLKVNDGHAFV